MSLCVKICWHLWIQFRAFLAKPFFRYVSNEWSLLSDSCQGALSQRCICAFTAWREIYLVCNLDFGVKQLQSGAGEDFDITELWSKVRPGSSGEATACKFRPAPFSVIWIGVGEIKISSALTNVSCEDASECHSNFMSTVENTLKFCAWFWHGRGDLGGFYPFLVWCWRQNIAADPAVLCLPSHSGTHEDLQALCHTWISFPMKIQEQVRIIKM